MSAETLAGRLAEWASALVPSPEDLELASRSLRDTRLPHGPDAEQDANRFAAAFLMPRASVLAHGLAGATSDHILAAKQTWAVSAMALIHRLIEVGLLTEWGYRTACVDLSRLGFRTGEPRGISRETSEGIGPSQVAGDLRITTSELTRHVFGLIPTAITGDSASGPPKAA